MASKKPDTQHPALSWREVMAKLKACKKEEEALNMILEEQAGENRASWISRMAGTYKVLRNARLDADLAVLIRGK